MPAFALNNRYANSTSSGSEQEEEEEEENLNPRNSKSSKAKPKAKPSSNQPKLSSSTSSSHKRSRINDHQETEEEDEEMNQEPTRLASSKAKAKTSSSSTSRKQQKQKPSNSISRAKSQHTNITTTEEGSEDDDEHDEELGSNLESRLGSMQARYNATKQELKEVQKQFDDLRELRTTQAEAQLYEYKKVSEARHKHSEDLIATLKQRLASSEKTIRKLEGGGDSSMSRISGTPAAMSRNFSNQGDSERLGDLERERDEALEQAKINEEENTRLRTDLKMTKSELKAEVANSKALQQAASSRSLSKNDPIRSIGNSKESEENKDLTVLRKVYEDLTGVIFTKVETYDSKGGLRRFSGIYSKKDSYNLAFCLEESRSETQDSRGKPLERADLVYFPQIDDDRDAQLLEALQGKKKALTTSIRFDRQMATSFFKMMLDNLQMKKN